MPIDSKFEKRVLRSNATALGQSDTTTEHKQKRNAKSELLETEKVIDPLEIETLNEPSRIEEIIVPAAKVTISRTRSR